MAEKEIRLGGIERNLSPANNADGAMEMLVGWRFSDGNLRPAPIPAPIDDIEYLSKDEDLLYVHKYGDYKHYIVYDGGRRIIYSPLYYCAEDGTVCERIEIFIFRDVEKPSSVCSVGNILIFCFGGILRNALRADDAEYGYRYVAIEETKLPLVTFKQETKNGESQQNWYYESDAKTIEPDQILGYSQIIGNSYPHVIANRNFVTQISDEFAVLRANFRYRANRENVLVDSYLVRYGFRMYDGEYLYLSPPILVRGEPYKMWTDSAIYSAVNKQWEKFQSCKLGGNGYKLLVSLSNVDELDYVIENRLFVAIDVFFSLPIPTYDSNRRIDSILSAKGYDSDDKSKQFYSLEWGSSIPPKAEDIEQYFNFYRVFSIGTDEISKYKEKIYNEFNINDKMEIISQLPLLEYKNSPHTYNANGTYVYNGRLHAYDVKDVLFSGFELPYFSFIRDFGGEHVSAEEAVVVVYIRRDMSEYCVRASGDEFLDRVDVLSPFVSYPDGNAFKMAIAIKSGEKYYKRELVLWKHPFADMAYYMEAGDAKCLNLVSDNYEITKDEFSGLKTLPENKIVIRPNVMKVSKLNNPIVFPLATTYNIGSGNIIAAAVATKPISQGQFGQYPLYVFTTDGIYAMLTGSGDVVYSNMAPVSRHVCVNRRTVCQIDDAVVFGTEQGLFVMQGGNAVNISAPLDEHGFGELSSNGIRRLVEAEAGSIKVLPSLNTLLNEGVTAYQYKDSEVLFYVPDSGVSAAYSLKEKKWTAYEINLHSTIDCYPDLLWIVADEVGGKNICEMKVGGMCEYHKKLLFATRPMSLSTGIMMKRLDRVHALSCLSGSIKWIVAGSNDGRNWTMVWRADYHAEFMANMVASRIGGSYRYYSLILLCDDMASDSYVNSFVVEYENTFSGR